jgi:hypothetical protein
MILDKSMIIFIVTGNNMRHVVVILLVSCYWYTRDVDWLFMFGFAASRIVRFLSVEVCTINSWPTWGICRLKEACVVNPC